MRSIEIPSRSHHTESSEGKLFTRRLERFAQQQITRGVVGDGERITVALVAELEFAFEIGRPQIVGMQALGERSALSARARSRRMGDQAMPVEHGMNGAAGRYFYGVRESPQQAFANLARAPVRLFLFRRDNGRLDRSGQLIGVAKGSASAIAQSFDAALLIPLKDLVSGLARDPELAAQRRHTFAIVEPNHEAHSFVHNRTFLPWHPPHPPPWQAKKCNLCLRNVLLPMSRNGHSTYSQFGIAHRFSLNRSVLRRHSRASPARRTRHAGADTFPTQCRRNRH